MKLTLIRPNLGDFRSSDAMPPLALGILAARAPGWDITCYDDKVESVPTTLDTDLAALSVETFTARRAYALADAYRQAGITVVMGGHHPTFLPREALDHADAVVIGDAEGAWEQLLADFKQRRLQPIYQGDQRAPLADYRLDRSIFAGKSYRWVETIQFGRGCRFACDFCSIHAFYGTSVRDRPLAGLRAELECLDHRKLLFFVDDNLFGSRVRLLALLALLTPLKLRWACQISLDVAADDELLDRLAAAGCQLAVVGFESMEAANLSQMGKRWNQRAGDYREVVRKLHARGIGVYGTFVFGYDHDTPDSITRAVEFAIDARLEVANFNPLTPTPGSRLYERLRQEGRLLSPAWWRDPDWRYGDPIFAPRGMPAEVMAAAVFAAKERFYSWRSIGRRLLRHDGPRSIRGTALMAAANLVSRREIHRKQHRPLGT
jgi:radical SAM superfamily enzyme YgiQ (UPF0313 family)